MTVSPEVAAKAAQEVRLSIIEDEPSRLAFLGKFGEAGVLAMRLFAERRHAAGMGPVAPTSVHPAFDERAADAEEVITQVLTSKSTD